MLLLLGITIVSAQDVRYYKLTKKKENGKISNDVFGGQFITFRDDVCFESNKNGVGVNHGTMQRNENYSNSQYLVYQQKSGSGCYWGKDATFKFTSDKSKLNVVLDNGDIYLYERTTAPAGQETCSLIRKPSSNTGGNSGSFPGGNISVYPDQPNATMPSPPSNSNTGTTQQKPRYEKHEIKDPCHLCYGSGKCSTCNGKHWFYGFDGKKITCPNCKPDGKCSACGGSGHITRIEWY